MSRTRIVGGKYTKIIGGNYNISAEGSIKSSAAAEVTDNGREQGVLYGDYERLGSNVNEDFDLQFSLKKNDGFDTVVPFGILDFNGKTENAFFAFNFSLMVSNVDVVTFEISDSDGKLIYAVGHLPEIVITAKRHPKLQDQLTQSQPEYNILDPVKIWDWKSIYNSFNVSPSDYTKIGSYILFWDGFDNDGIYDSSRFDDKTLTAKITAEKNGIKKTKEVEVKTKYKEVNWVDVRIDRNKNKIDATLRVNLKDGGAKGLNCSSTTVRSADYQEASDRLGVDNPIKKDFKMRFCDWDKIPKSSLIPGKTPITSRTRSFADLEQLAIDGLNYHWGRNENHAVAKDLKILDQGYAIYLDAVNTPINAMDDINLVYNTNGKWMRSGNPGSATWNPISWVGNLVSREAICYNVGYIKYSNGWAYQPYDEEDVEFKETAAHEIGHEILKTFGGTPYSYGHKGSVNVVTQSNNKTSTNYPMIGEIDIMPYYNNYIPIADRNRMAAAEKDVLGLVWLTKIKLK